MKKFSILTGIMLACSMGLTLVGCNDKNKVRLVDVDPYKLDSNFRDLRISGMGMAGEQFTEHSYIDEKAEKEYRKYAVEDVKVLVVPVDFTNYPSTDYGAGETQTESEEASRRMLQKVFFGGPEDMEWYSLREYYKSTSFGTCNVSGVIAPWYHTEISSNSVPKSGGKPDTAYARQIAIKLQNKYRNVPITDVDGNSYNLADFDANKDGFVDTIIMLYTPPITTTGELWWAFASSVSGAYGVYTPDGKMEGANRFFWASFKFLFEKDGGGYYTPEEIKDGTAKPDVHTMTHEFGHCLSLPDYYVTDYGDDYAGLGGLDMMDNNIGDHNAYSKTLYGWINPKRVAGKKGKTTFKLRSTTTTGDAVIIPAPGEWNDTYLDQYLMIEFITPEGVAKKDGEKKYLGYYPLYYNKAGVRITHVDARLGKFVYNSSQKGWEFSGYTGNYSGLADTEYVGLAASNTASDSAFPAYKEIELLPATGIYMSKGGEANNDALYIEGDCFGYNGKFEDFKFNGIDGSQEKEFGFKIHIDKIEGNDSATITVSR